ncbi:MAG TPA: pitrilysin family protein [Thermoanaerobaculia bacterium]|nr:pitrilysin family protein [Thermoanaerobaculia bacterium]
METRFAVPLALLALAACALSARAAEPSADIFPFPVAQKTLANGLQVVAVPFDSPGTVAYYTVVRTGARDEVEPGKSGFAHFFEHMMFRGTDKYSKDRYTEILKRMGADSNASTDDDLTLYHIVGPKRELETMADLESDRFKNLKYTEPVFRTEALAVRGEYAKNASNPLRQLFEKLRGLAFSRHTYQHTAMGFLADIEAMPEQYAYSRQFFQRFYRPENCVVLVVGDVDPAQVFQIAERYYGDWQRGYQPVEVPAEPPQTGAKSAQLDWSNPVRPQVLYGYRAPAFSTASVDWATLDLISQLLFSESAPLYQELVVEKQWADSLSGGISVQRDPSLFNIFVRARSLDVMPQVEKTIADHLAKLGSEPVDPVRLDRIKSHLRYAFAASLDSPGTVAEQLAVMLATTGDVQSLNQLYRRYAEVTPADVQRVARQILVPAGETKVNLVYVAPNAAPGGN